MAIRKKTDIGGNTGMSGDYWKLCDLQLFKGAKPGTTKCVGAYRMWLSAEAYTSEKQPMRRGRKHTLTVPSADPKISDIEAVFDAELTRPTIPEVKAVAAVKGVKAQAAVKADKAKGISAQPAIAGVKAVKAVARVRGVAGGELEGGAIVRVAPVKTAVEPPVKTAKPYWERSPQ